MANQPGTRLKGYGSHHQQLRRQWRLLVDRGEVACARCGRPIIPGTPWDLGHDDHDRTKYKGPEHAKCNRGAPHRKVTSWASRYW